MTQAKHTPGPWRIIETESAAIGQRAIVDADGFTICNPSPLGEANARLIANGPELLEALKRAAPWLGRLIADGGHANCVMPNDAVRTLEMVEAAIAKATGS